jgi:CheY-like chemotaxis protein
MPNKFLFFFGLGWASWRGLPPGTADPISCVIWYGRGRPIVHFAVRYALEEQQRRKARLRRKRRVSAACAEPSPVESQLVDDCKYAAALRLLGAGQREFLRLVKKRGYCTFDELNARLPEDALLSCDEIEQLMDMFANLNIELRDAAPAVSDDLVLLEGKRILLIHPESLLLVCLTDALEEAGAEVIGVRTLDGALHRAKQAGFDGAVMNFLLQGAPPLKVVEVLHERGVPIVFYTAIDAREVARQTGHINCAIVTNPGPREAVVAALAALLTKKSKPWAERLKPGQKRLRSFLDN